VTRKFIKRFVGSDFNVLAGNWQYLQWLDSVLKLFVDIPFCFV